MHFTNKDLKDFADEKINIKRADLTDFREQVNRIKDNLTEYLKNNPSYGLVKMLHSGSVAKGTALRTLNDMDVAVYIKSNEVDTTDEAKLLQHIRDALATIYKRYNMKDDQFTIGHHCVKINFKGSGLDVDVVPVIYEGEEDDRGYLITKDTGERVLTSITLHKKFIRERKNEHSNYAQMVRITKWWRDQRDFKFKSFLIEMVWAHIADTEGIESDIAGALKQFFRYIINSELQDAIIFTDNYKANDVTLQDGVPNIFDPVNPENNVGASLDDERLATIIEEADEAFGYLVNAEQASTKTHATHCLKQIFGSSFSL